MKILIVGTVSDFTFLQRKLKHFLKRIKSKPILLYRSDSSLLYDYLKQFCYLNWITSNVYQQDETDDAMLKEARAMLIFGKIDRKLLEKAQKRKLQIRMIE